MFTGLTYHMQLLDMFTKFPKGAWTVGYMELGDA